VSAIKFRPVTDLVAEADRRIHDVEGHGLEDLVVELYEERSRKGLAGFPLSGKIKGYWNSKDTEIDMVALDEPGRRIRFGFCKRAPARLVGGLADAEGHVRRFLSAHPRYSEWRRELVGIAPVLDPGVRDSLRAKGWLAQDLMDLADGLLPVAGSPRPA
jgi:hypothetical protein